MSKYCSDCRNLNINKKMKKIDKGVEKEISGMYHCYAKDTYINPSSPACEDFDSNFIGAMERDRLYKEGKDAADAKHKDDTPVGVYIFIFFIIVIVWIIAKLMGY